MTSPGTGEPLTLSQRVLLALKETRSKLETYERAKSEPIAIIGMGCRFPGGADSPELFWDLLCRGDDAVREVPADRWDVEALYDPDPDIPGKTSVRAGGFLQHVDLFDAHFFGISPREARSLDPQQRLLLEVAWEAFENAGQGRDSLFGNQVGVFIGIGNVDYARLMHESARSETVDLYATTGNVISAAAGRLSYTLGLQGPSMSLDTACSSSLVAIHLACQSLRTDESVLALAGGVNLILAAETMVAMSRVPGGLSADGRCKAFDASANGLGRGEGCGLVVLKRLSDAIRDRDNVFAVIRGSAVNQDGRSAGLTVPNGQAQAALIQKALSNSRVSPDDVSYLEAHGPGTALGDPIEAGALGVVFGGTSRKRPLIVGSVKTNIGHLESAAGVAGFMKTALVLHHGEIPPNLHFDKPNPHIPWDRIPITVPTARTPMVASDHSRVAGVSAFGVAGTNAHAVLEEFPQSDVRRDREHVFWKTPKYLLTLSARSEPALQQLVARYKSHFDRQPNLALTDVVYTASVGRFHFPHRVAILAYSTDRMKEQLEIASTGGQSVRVLRGEASTAPSIGFLFTDSSSVDSGTGHQLYEMFSVFRSAFDECDRLIQKKAGWSLRAALYPEKGQPSSLHQPEQSCPAHFALGYSLAALWRSWGIAPAVVAGRGVGEIVAAAVADILSVEQGLDLSLAWGNNQSAGDVETALEKVVSQMALSQPATPIVSQLTAQRVSEEMRSTRYWASALATKTQSSKPFQNEKVDIVLEMGRSSSPREIRHVPAGTGHTLATLRHDVSDLETTVETLAALYVSGATINWGSFYKDLPCRRTVLPTYPFQRQRHWFERRETPLKTAEGSTADPLGSYFYKEEWRPQPRIASSSPRPAAIGTWLILADNTGVGAEAVRELQRGGNTCVVLLARQAYEELDEHTICVNADSPADFDRLMLRLTERGLGPMQGIVHLWSIDGDSLEPTLPELKEIVKTECASILHLIQSVMKAHSEHVPPVWLVTRGAVQVNDQDVPRLMQYPIWGMARVIANEHPELSCTRIDLDPNAGPENVTELLAEIHFASGEKEMAFRSRQRFVSRLARWSQQSLGNRPQLTLRPDATYLITGGMGGLGRVVARWMIDKGARHIMVLGRSALRPGVEAHFEDLQKSGARVAVIRADVSDPEQVEHALSQIADVEPLRGVVHCPAVLDDGIFMNQSWERFERVLRPKVDGAWNVHTLTRNADLDFFVLFSSASSVFGNPGQVNYATANAFLDGLARFRRARGLPGVSINWGIWSGAGGVTENRLERAINATGVGSIRPEEGLDALERALFQPSPQVAVIPIRWPEFLKRTGDWSFVDDFRATAAKTPDSTPPFIEALTKAPLRERRSLLLNHIRSHVDHVLRTNTAAAFGPKQGFFEMGMDSLTAVELKNRLQTSLGCRLPSTVAFECPTIEALVDSLVKETLAPLFVPDQSVPTELPTVAARAEAENPEPQLSEEEVNGLLDEKLKAIETFLDK